MYENLPEFSSLASLEMMLCIRFLPAPELSVKPGFLASPEVTTAKESESHEDAFSGRVLREWVGKPNDEIHIDIEK